MCPQISCLIGYKITLVALVWFSSLCFFKRLYICIVTLVTFVWLFSLNCVPGKRQSHIGCICLTSPLCVFKWVLKLYAQEDVSHWLHLFDFSPLCVFKCLLKSPTWLDIKSHWLQLFGFLHCVFSSESSNGLPKRMHCHIGCICLTFLHCAFSYVSSNRMNCFVLQNIVIEYTGRVPSIHPGPISSTNNS